MGEKNGRDDRVNKDEFQKFYRYITSVAVDTNPSPEKTQVYWDTLNDLPFNVAMIAAQKVLTTLENPFLPMPAVFRGAAITVTGPSIQSAPDAYNDVLRAIRNFGSYRETEALQSLTPLTRKAAEAIGWKGLCLSEEPDVIRGQFRMAYEALEKREIVDAKTPQKLKDVIASMGGDKTILIIGQGTPPRKICREYLDEVSATEETTEESDNIREQLAKMIRNRPRESQMKKTDPKELEKFYL